MTCDTWHMIYDMWHIAHDMWQMTHKGWWTLSQVASSYDLGVKVFWRFEEKDASVALSMRDDAALEINHYKIVKEYHDRYLHNKSPTPLCSLNVFCNQDITLTITFGSLKEYNGCDWELFT